MSDNLLESLKPKPGFFQGPQAKAMSKNSGNIEVDKEDIEARIRKQKIDFFTLLTTQLKRQDPTQPMNTNEMTQNIFSMNMVEQQLQTNKLLEQMTQTLEHNRVLDSVTYIGKQASYTGDRANVIDGKVDVEFEIKGEPDKVELQLIDPRTKRELRKPVELDAKTGTNKVSVDIADLNLQNGVYMYKIKALDKFNNPLPVKQFSSGRVSAVIADGYKDYMFEINNEAVELSKILKLHESEDNTAVAIRSLDDINSGIKSIGQYLSKREDGVLPTQSTAQPDVLMQVQEQIKGLPMELQNLFAKK